MLDSYHINRSSPDVRVNITEHRAPTDQSIALAEQMRKEVFQSVMASGTARNEIHANWCVVRDPMEWSSRLHIRMTINGKEVKTEVNLDDFDLNPRNMAEMLPFKIRDAIVAKIAAEICIMGSREISQLLR